MQHDRPVVAALRAATASRHHTIETVLRLDQPLDRARYRRVLEGFHWFLSHWEPRLLAHLPPRLHGWFEARSRRAMAERDLQALPVQDNKPPPATDPTDGLVLDSLAAQFGSLYVMEGSALGGQVIARDLKDRLGLTPEHGTAYFHGWGEHTGAQWRDFRDRLELEVGPQPAAIHIAIAAANTTFDALTQAFRLLLDDAQPA